MTPTFSSSVKGVLTATIFAAVAQPSEAAPVRGVCSPSKAAYLASSANASNTTSTFQALPESAVNFRQGGSKPSCVIVYFFGKTTADQTGLYLRALIDGSSASVIPDSPSIERNPDIFVTSNTVIYVIPNVAPGSHRISFQFRSSGNGNLVAIGSHNVVVMHAP